MPSGDPLQKRPSSQGTPPTERAEATNGLRVEKRNEGLRFATRTRSAGFQRPTPPGHHSFTAKKRSAPRQRPQSQPVLQAPPEREEISRTLH
jgi:hypothetical protein